MERRRGINIEDRFALRDGDLTSLEARGSRDKEIVGRTKQASNNKCLHDAVEDAQNLELSRRDLLVTPVS